MTLSTSVLRFSSTSNSSLAPLPEYVLTTAYIWGSLIVEGRSRMACCTAAGQANDALFFSHRQDRSQRERKGTHAFVVESRAILRINAVTSSFRSRPDVSPTPGAKSARELVVVLCDGGRQLG